MRGFRLVWVAGLLLALVVARVFSPETPPGAPNAIPSVTQDSQNSHDAAPQAVNAGGWAGGEANADRHWEKHGGQFREFRTERAYENGADTFVHHPPPGTLVKHRSNGDMLYFDPASGDFAVEDARGRPRTFFKPDDGMNYWNRQ